MTAAHGDELVATVREWSGGAGADVVIIAVGDPGLVPIAARCTAIGGYISCFAGFPAGTLAQIDPNLIHYRELTISGSANATLEDYAAAVATLSTGALDLSPLITHEFPSPRWTPRSTPYARAPASRSLCAPDAASRPSASQAAPAGPRH